MIELAIVGGILALVVVAAWQVAKVAGKAERGKHADAELDAIARADKARRDATGGRDPRDVLRDEQRG